MTDSTQPPANQPPPPERPADAPPPPPQQAGYAPPPSQQANPVGRPTNLLAILSLVAAFVFPIAGIVLGVIARKQIRETGEAGDGLAQAGLILSIVFTVLGLLVAIVGIVLFVTTGAFFVNMVDISDLPTSIPAP